MTETPFPHVFPEFRVIDILASLGRGRLLIVHMHHEFRFPWPVHSSICRLPKCHRAWAATIDDKSQQASIIDGTATSDLPRDICLDRLCGSLFTVRQ